MADVTGIRNAQLDGDRVDVELAYTWQADGRTEARRLVVNASDFRDYDRLRWAIEEDERIRSVVEQGQQIGGLVSTFRSDWEAFCKQLFDD